MTGREAKTQSLLVLSFALPLLLFSGTAAAREDGSLDPTSAASGGAHPSVVPPFLDATASIIEGDTPFPEDPTERPAVASVNERGALAGGDVARIRLRVEGKGEPIVLRIYSQMVVILSQSSSMEKADPAGARCEFTRNLAWMHRVPHELGLVDYESDARVAVPVGTSYQQVANWAQCYSVGEANLSAGIRAGVDALKPSKKSGFMWSMVLITDGNITAGDPLPEVERAAEESLRIFVLCVTSGGSADCTHPALTEAAQRTGGKFYRISPHELPGLAGFFAPDDGPDLKMSVAGKPPRSGEPMVRFALGPGVEVVRGSFRCASASCSKAEPDSPPAADVVDGNRGLILEWVAPAREIEIRQVWEVEFSVRAHSAGQGQMASIQRESRVLYDRYDGSPGGSDTFEQLKLDVRTRDKACGSGAWYTLFGHRSPETAEARKALVLEFTSPSGGSHFICKEDGQVLEERWEEWRAIWVSVRFSSLGYGSGVVSVDGGESGHIEIPAKFLRAGTISYRFEALLSDGSVHHHPDSPEVTWIEVAVVGAEEETALPWIDILIVAAVGAGLGAAAAPRVQRGSEESSPEPVARANATLRRLPRRHLHANPATKAAIRRAAQKRTKEG